jgi:DNA-binding transcriptional LysR family regulator
VQFRQIEAFRALMLAQSELGAAEVLGVSQSAVSRIIGRLESELHLALFDRANGRLIPTEEARILYQEVEQVSRSMERLRELAADLSEARTGDLRISAMPALALEFVPKVIARFSEKFPKLRVKFEMAGSDDIERQITNHMADLGIVELPVGRSGLKWETFCSVQQVVVVPQQHELSRHRKITPKQLQKYEVMAAVRNSKSATRHVHDILKNSAITLNPRIDTQTMLLICQAVLSGSGVGIVDPFTADRYLASGLKAIPFEPAIKFEVGIVFSSHRLLTKQARFFLRALREERSIFLKKWSAGAEHD